MVSAFALVAALAVAVSTTTAAANETGVTARTIKIGGTYPLTGPASLYAPIPGAMKAYFSYINARRGPDGKRGVGGRQIVFTVYDDGYNPANTVQLTRKLVEQDKVFAVVGSLGTANNVAIRPYLNSRKVPQILNATGATIWGAETTKYPWTIGWQPPYSLEGKIYGQAIARNSPNAKIGVLYQNDEYGFDYLTGLKAGLGGKTSNIVGEEAYEVTATSVATQVAKLRASGATVFVIFATPRATIQAYVIAKTLGWNPPVIYTNSVSGTDTFLTTAQRAGAGALVNNTFTVQYAKDPASPVWDDDAGMKLYRQVMSKYYPNGSNAAVQANSLNLYGVAVAHAFVQLLYKAGKNPTRAGLMQAARNWNEASPFLLPGNAQRTKGADQFPVSCEQIVKFTDGTFKAVSKLKCGSPRTGL
ncbi:MAG: ABC transporter substrate-binding protein [Thermoleophilia bacterium]|nr:ABC transporter substrate-binding protein [Thermoleophilia bacterium]MDH5332463.1 ABC transporter substrate-binding protein [Thermoleophilia bacterium]